MTCPSRVLVVFVVAVVGLIVPIAAQQPIAKYSAQIINFEAPVGGATVLAQIQINRWSTDAERDRLTNTLFESGGPKLLELISKDRPARGIHPHARQCRLSIAIRPANDDRRC